MRIATWNINSIRLRLNNVIRFAIENNIDIICLQETKTINENFPLKDFYEIGFKYYHIRGEKSYNGVAILSKLPITFKGYINWCKSNDTRHIYVQINESITLHNFYIPAGGDLPDTRKNKKFKHKIDFLKEMIKFFKKDKTRTKILLGDLNIAPNENDVWSHKQLTNVISHTPIEIKFINNLLEECMWNDVIRYAELKNKKLFSWWSYRSKDWKKSNRGRRLDHIFVSNNLLKLVKKRKIFKELRGDNKPSDHVPVMIEIENCESL